MSPYASTQGPSLHRPSAAIRLGKAIHHRLPASDADPAHYHMSIYCSGCMNVAADGVSHPASTPKPDPLAASLPRSRLSERMATCPRWDGGEHALHFQHKHGDPSITYPNILLTNIFLPSSFAAACANRLVPRIMSPPKRNLVLCAENTDAAGVACKWLVDQVRCRCRFHLAFEDG